MDTNYRMSSLFNLNLGSKGSGGPGAFYNVTSRENERKAIINRKIEKGQKTLNCEMCSPYPFVF
jgi:hypothetical protein